MSLPSTMKLPSMRTPSMKSFIRFRHRSSVDLPHPDGPMNAVTCFSGISSETSCRACLAPYQRFTFLISTAVTPVSVAGFTNSTFRFAMGPARSEGRRLIPAAQAASHHDRGQIQEDDDHEQQDRRGV